MAWLTLTLGWACGAPPLSGVGSSVATAPSAANESDAPTPTPSAGANQAPTDAESTSGGKAQPANNGAELETRGVAPSSSSNSSPEVPTGTTVLHVGDSFAGALGIELNKLFEAAGIKGVLRYKTATYIPTWAGDKDLGAYLRRYRPDLVLVTLGANELKIPDPEVRAATIHRLIARFEGRPCVWIAPPLWAEGAPLLEVIRRECAPCVYMDTNQLITHMTRTRDKIHPSTEAREQWARVVYDWLLRHRSRTADRVWNIVPDGD